MTGLIEITGSEGGKQCACLDGSMIWKDKAHWALVGSASVSIADALLTMSLTPLWGMLGAVAVMVLLAEWELRENS